MSLERETILLTERQRETLQRRILHRYHDLGEIAGLELTERQFRDFSKRVLGEHYRDEKAREDQLRIEKREKIKKDNTIYYGINDIKELLKNNPEIEDRTIIRTLVSMKIPCVLDALISSLRSIEDYHIGYEFGNEWKNISRIISYKKRKTIFKRCGCGSRMLDVNPRVQDQRTGKVYTIGKTILYCPNCGTNYDNTTYDGF